MLTCLITILFLLPALCGFGAAGQKVFGVFFCGISGQLLCGTATITIFSAIAAFFIPLNIYFECAVLLAGFSAFFYFKAYESFYAFFRRPGIPFIAAIICVIFFSSLYPFILDHFGYYVPTIAWLKTFGFVKGISNLDLLLGQMSIWHTLQAAFSNFSDPFLRMNAVAISIYLIYIFEKKLWLHLSFLPFLFLFLSSPSPDLPAISFALIVLNELLCRNKNLGWLFTISAIIFAIKPTVFWPMCAVFLIGINDKRNSKFLYGGSAVLIIFLAKNLYCYGFLVFPAQFPDLGISWKPNSYLLKISSEVAVEKTYDMQYSAAEISKFSRADIIKKWFLLPGIKGKINLALIFSLAALAVHTFQRKRRIITVIFVSVCIKTLAVMLFSAQYRFFMDVFFVTAAVIFYAKNSRKAALAFFFTINLILGLFFTSPKLLSGVFPSFRLGSFISPYHLSQIWEPGTFSLKTYRSFTIGNLKFNVVRDYPFSFDTPLPAISPGFLREYYRAGIFPQKNSKNLSEGFHWKNLNREERAYLAKIIGELNKNPEEIHSKE